MNKWQQNNYYIKRGKAISAKLLESNLKIQLYNPVIFRTSPVILGTTASKNKTFGKVFGYFWYIVKHFGMFLYICWHFGTYRYLFTHFGYLWMFLDVFGHFGTFRMFCNSFMFWYVKDFLVKMCFWWKCFLAEFFSFSFLCENKFFLVKMCFLVKINFCWLEKCFLVKTCFWLKQFLLSWKGYFFLSQYKSPKSYAISHVLYIVWKLQIKDFYNLTKGNNSIHLIK